MKTRLNIKKRYLLILLPFYFILLSFPSAAQSEGSSGWDTVLFVKHMEGVNNKTVNWAGDQNGDGKDDILLYDCTLGKLSLYLGGNPMDTIPVWEVYHHFRSFLSVDINNDGIRDLILIGNQNDNKIKVFYGGLPIDTIPNLIFSPPPSIRDEFGYYSFVLRDFNGDEKEDILIYTAWQPEQIFGPQWGLIYRYNINPVLDTIPVVFIQGDSIARIRIYASSLTNGDINGDGKTDVLLSGADRSGSEDRPFMSLYLGNENWSMEPEFSYYDDEHLFNATSWRIIKDVNKDGRDDILIPSYGEFYPYYYRRSIIYGKIPLDTIPNIGLNTQDDGINSNYYISGDFNGDGYNDLLTERVSFGAQQAKLWVGGGTMPELPKKYWYYPLEPPVGPLFGKVGDVDGDGVEDVCVGTGWAVETLCRSGVVVIFKGDTSVKTDTTTSVDMEEDNNIIDNYYLYEPYPNPFNSSIVVSYQLAVGSNIKIKIYDTLGREVITLVDKYENAGKHQIEFSAKGGQASGVYFIQYEINSLNGAIKTETKKITFMK